MKKLLFILTLLLWQFNAMAQSYSGGAGTTASPYLIGNLTDLLYLSNNSGEWAKHFRQTANIDASSTSTLNAGAGFNPIGNATTQFRGSYNGGGNTITGLVINRPTTDYVGLFGYPFSASISNLGMLGGSVSGKLLVGSLVGFSYSMTVTNSYATGSVSGAQYVGGLVGFNNNSTITNSYATGSVSATGNVASSVGDCVGGLVGYSGDATITNSYATGSVSGTTIGGIGGLVGLKNLNAIVNSSYWNTITSGQTTSAGGTGRTTAQMQTQATFVGWDFVGETTNGTADIWKMDLGCPNNGYPILSYQTTSAPPAAPMAIAQSFFVSSNPTVVNLVATGTAIQWYANATGGSALATSTTLATGNYYASQTVNGCESERVLIVVTVSAPPQGASLDFDGSNDYVTLPRFDFSGNNKVTIEAWIKPTNITTKVFYEIARQQNPPAAPDFLVSFQGNGTILSFGLNTTTGYSELDVPITASQWTDGNWHHVAVVYDGVIKRVYKDGVQIGFENKTGNIVSNAASVNYIGFSPESVVEAFHGNMDEVRYWNRALCLGEILNNKDCQLNPTGQANLYAYYQFNQGEAGLSNAGVTALTDVSGNSRNGTLTNFGLTTGGTSNWVTPGGVSSTVTCSAFVLPAAPTATTPQGFPNTATIVNLTTTTGVNIQWYAAASGGAALATSTALVNGTTYHVSQTVDGCESARTAVGVTVNSPLVIPVAPQTNVSCNGGSNGSASVTPSGGAGGYTYSWSPSGGAAATATGLSAGTYTVTVTDAIGSIVTRDFTITQPTAISTATAAQTNVSCNGGSNGSASVTPSGGAGGYTYSWFPSGGTAATATGLTAGSYTVTVTDANSCTATRNFTITQPAQFRIFSFNASQTSCFGQSNGTSLMTFTGGVIPYTYLWSNGTTAQTATGLAAGTYTCTATDANGCTASQNVTITQPAQIVINPATLPNGVAGVSYSQALTLTGTALPHTYSILSGSLPTGLTIDSSIGIIAGIPTTAGTFNFTVLASRSCEPTRAYSIVIACPTITAPIASAQQFLAAGSTVGNLTAVGSGIQWYAAVTGGPALLASTPLINGTTYFASQTVGVCESTRSPVRVIITANNVAINFDNSNDFMRVANNTSLNFTTSMTVEFWVRTKANTVNNDYIIGKANSYSWTGGFNFTFSGNNKINFAPQGWTGNSTTNVFQTSTIPVNTWTHVAGTYDGTTANLYINGFLNTSIPLTGAIPLNAFDLFIGADNGVSYFANCDIDMVRLWNTARTQTQIASNLNNCISASTTGLVAQYDFEEVVGSLAFQDTSGNGLHGSYNNMETPDWISGATCASTYVACAPLAFTNTTATNAVLGSLYNLNASVSGNTQPVTYSITPALPTGLSIGATTGIISGTPTVLSANTTYTVTATTQVSCVKTQDYSFEVVCPTLVFETTSLPNRDYNQAYSQLVLVSNSTTAVTYTITLGSLPTGFSLSPTGTISGTSIDIGTFTFTILATDVNGCKVSQEFSIGLSQIPITVTALTNTKVFGTIDPILTYNVVPSLQAGDSFTGELERIAGEDVGTYAINQSTLTAGPNYLITFVGANFTITKASQTITWDQDLIIGCDNLATYILNANSSSGLPVDYISQDNSIATITGSTLNIVNQGSVNIIASQSGNANFDAATNVIQTLVVSQPGLIRKHWRDVLFFDNSSNEYSGYRWYKNGVLVANANQQYFKDTAALNGAYYATAFKNGALITTCTLTISEATPEFDIKVFPNPSLPGRTFEVETTLPAAILLAARIDMYNQLGALVGQTTVTGSKTLVNTPIVQGVYIVRLVLSNGNVFSLNLLVK